jgi:hypothetical protein
MAKSDTPARHIDARIKELGDWRGKTLARVRKLIHDADPEVVETWKWRGVPVWEHGGIICTGETYKSVVKMTFAKGASLKDPKRLFNSSLEGSTRRAIDIHEGEKIDEKALKALIQEAVALNQNKKPAKGKKPVLLSGGNPQIAKADGDAPVQKYIQAMPGWKQDIGRRIDALVTKHVPKVRKAVKWNSPLYGIEGRGWFMAFHVYTRFVKVTFFKGTSLKPQPYGGAAKEMRWIDVHEDDFNETQLAKWIKQASKLPGWGKA